MHIIQSLCNIWNRPLAIFLSTISFSLGMIGCGKSGPSDVSHRTIEGSISQSVDVLTNSEWAEQCDRNLAEKKMEVAEALDSRASEIQELARTFSTSTRYRQVVLGPTFAREPVASPSPQPGWVEETKSWEEIYQLYTVVKDQPVNENWILLNAYARGVLVDDEDRVLHGKNFYLDRDSIPTVETLHSTVSECNSNPTCTSLQLSTQQQIFAARNPIYNFHWGRILRESDRNKLRDFIAQFAGRLSRDLMRLTFTNNPTVSRTGSEITLPLDVGPFSASHDALRNYIESVWTGPQLRLKIQWTSAPSNSNIFRFLLGDRLGERPFVSLRDKTINLFPNVRTKSIAHEIGHVLGFEDHYYTVWHPESCRYVNQYDESDIMSDSEQGSVTPEEWSEIDRRYPIPSASTPAPGTIPTPVAQ